MAIIKRRYLAYLLRLWQIKDEGKLVWRASLEDPQTGERQGFASMQALIDFLWRQVSDSNSKGGPDQNSNGNE
jgi:hypothetical protein